jgi:NADP-dependent 3-hydroxy acid dehydrogenase YdfG
MVENEWPVAMVTGAASGIGLATVKELACTGMTVVAVDRQAKPLHAEVERLRAEGLHVAGRADDVGDAEAMGKLANRVMRNLDRLDLVVACAGTTDQSDIASGDPQRWRDVVDTNLLGVAYTARAALPHMTKQGSGHIIVVASAAGRTTYAGEPVYVASKRGAVAFADSLRKEVARHGIRVTVIEPGLVATPMLDGDPIAEDMMQTVTPLDPTDCARAIRFAYEQPPHVSLNEIVIHPTAQEM